MKKWWNSLRYIAFVLLFISSLFVPLWLLLLLSLFYALRWHAYELIVLGFLIDAQFGIGVVTVPYVYTLSLGLLLLIIECAKPYLMLYE